MPAALTVALVVLASTIAAGCGDGEGKPPRETVDPLPRLPRGWKAHVNRDGGFAVGVPPGWRARARGDRSELRSPRLLVAISLAADRGDAALEVPLRGLARDTLDAGLPDVRRLEHGRARPRRHRYDAVSVVATGLAGSKPPVRERLELVVIRREGLATYYVLVAENAEARGRPHRNRIERIVGTLRGRPVGARREAGLGPSG